MTETVIRLVPEHLGQVEVKLSMQNGQLTATFTTETASAKDALESNLAILRSNLQSQGVAVDRLIVSQQSSLQSGMFHDGRERQHSGRESERDGKQRKEQNGDDWRDILAVGGEEESLRLSMPNGTSFQATA